MKEMLDEYGGVTAAAISGLVLIGLLYAIMTPGNPIGDGVRQLLSVGLGE